MRSRVLELYVKNGFMRMPLGKVKIQKLADYIEQPSKRVCPACHLKPQYHGSFYTCTCCPKCGKPLQKVVDVDPATTRERVSWKCDVDGFQEVPKYSTWQDLDCVLPNGDPIVKTKLPVGDDGYSEADVKIMELTEFIKHVDSTVTDYGVTIDNKQTAENIKKLLIAVRVLGKVILLHFNDTFEERIGILTTSISNRIIIKEIIPSNIARVAETVKIDVANITEKDIAEANAFVSTLPKATEEDLTVKDYRTIGLDQMDLSEKVTELNSLIASLPKTN